MDEMSYHDALEGGFEPIQFRSEYLQELGPGHYAGYLDALVWRKAHPSLLALITLDNGIKTCVIAYHRDKSKRDPLPYSGLRLLAPGMKVDIDLQLGVRGGLIPRVTRHRDSPPRPSSATA